MMLSVSLYIRNYQDLTGNIRRLLDGLLLF